MPILEVEVVGPTSPRARRGLARRVADAAGAALGSPPGATWVLLRRLPASDYAESGGGPPRGVRPVFVSVLLAKPPRGRARAAQVARLAGAVARACGRPAENVHVLYRAPAAGRIAFGGRLYPPPARRDRTAARNAGGQPAGSPAGRGAASSGSAARS